MRSHPTRVEGYDGTLEDLAKAVFRMRYDKVAEFLLHGCAELQRQSEADRSRGRTKLAMLLAVATKRLGGLVELMVRIFLFCRPFMKQELLLKNEHRHD